MQKLEVILGRSIASAYDASPDVAKGLLWANNTITPNASPQDVEAGLNMIRQTILSNTQVKQGQALVSQWDTDEYENQPGINLFVSQDAANQPQHPGDSQRIGVMQNPAFAVDDKDFKQKPGKKKKKPKIKKSTIDERVCNFLRISITK